MKTKEEIIKEYKEEQNKKFNNVVDRIAESLKPVLGIVILLLVSFIGVLGQTGLMYLIEGFPLPLSVVITFDVFYWLLILTIGYDLSYEYFRVIKSKEVK